MSNPSVVLWGIGNPLNSDDAAGPVLADRIKAKAPEWLNVFNCETVPENYLAPLGRISPETLIIVDAADMGIDPGEIRRMTLKDFSNVSFSTHGLPLDIMLEGYNPAVIIIGIQPSSRDLSMELSPPVMNALDRLEELILSRKWATIPDIHQEKRSPR